MYIWFEIYILEQISVPTYMVHDVYKANKDNERTSRSLGIQFMRMASRSLGIQFIQMVIFQFVDIGEINCLHCLIFPLIIWNIYFVIHRFT